MLQAQQQEDCQVFLNWIPSKIGIPRNERGDEAAKTTLLFSGVEVSSSLSQIKNGIRQVSHVSINKNHLDIARACYFSAKCYLMPWLLTMLLFHTAVKTEKQW